MSDRGVERVVSIVLIVIGALVIIAVLGMWLMHTMMMGGMMGSMSGCTLLCSVPLLLLGAVVIVLAVVLLRRGR